MMREHSRHRLERGDGIATLYMQLSPNRNQYFLGTEAMSKTMTISTKHTEERFVSLTDVIQLLTNSAKDLAMVSPNHLYAHIMRIQIFRIKHAHLSMASSQTLR